MLKLFFVYLLVEHVKCRNYPIFVCKWWETSYIFGLVHESISTSARNVRNSKGFALHVDACFSALRIPSHSGTHIERNFPWNVTAFSLTARLHYNKSLLKILIHTTRPNDACATRLYTNTHARCPCSSTSSSSQSSSSWLSQVDFEWTAE